jgi:hypothetical protein
MKVHLFVDLRMLNVELALSTYGIVVLETTRLDVPSLSGQPQMAVLAILLGLSGIATLLERHSNLNDEIQSMPSAGFSCLSAMNDSLVERADDAINESLVLSSQCLSFARRAMEHYNPFRL